MRLIKKQKGCQKKKQKEGKNGEDSPERYIEAYKEQSMCKRIKEDKDEKGGRKR